MSGHKSLAFSLIGLFLYNSVSCDYYNGLPPVRAPLHPELTKNQLDNVQIERQNVSQVTRDLLWELTMVKKLEIKASNVRSIEKGAFNHLRSLLKLSIRHNPLEEVPAGVFNGLFIEELDLSDNRIRTIEADAFKHMKRLSTIRLSNNKIEEFNSAWFRDTPRVRYIHFENNLIKTLPQQIIEYVPYNWEAVSLIFSYNKIEEIDENAFRQLYIDELYLDHNAIQSVKTETFARAHKIEDLRLDHNKIICLTADIRTVRKFNVEGNPWNQTCLLEFKEQKDVKTTTSLPPTHALTYDRID